MTNRDLPTPVPGEEVAWVRTHLAHLCAEEAEGITASPRWRGTQAAADAALAAFEVAGYARRRNQVSPAMARGASGLSPWIRHGLLTLPQMWAAVASGPEADVQKFRDELAWQEYARHLRARLGDALGQPLRAQPAGRTAPMDGSAWDRTMVCVDTPLSELERDGYMVNQARMWMASQWTVRHGAPWRDGEDEFFRHLLDGSRAANRLGWQWSIGSGTGRPYGFSRRQVERRAPEWCATCPHARRCPIEHWPEPEDVVWVTPPGHLRRDPEPEVTAGPRVTEWRDEPDVVWLTAESLGEADPALWEHPDLPVVFVFDAVLLDRLRLSGKRLVFWAERLAELGAQRSLQVQLGDPAELVRSRRPAVTYAPVPGFRRMIAERTPAVLHPWPWLRRPSGGSLSSFSAWWGDPRRVRSRP